MRSSCTRAGMRPPMLTVMAAGVDVTKQPELWPAGERNYRGPRRPEIAYVFSGMAVTDRGP